MSRLACSTCGPEFGMGQSKSTFPEFSLLKKNYPELVNGHPAHPFGGVLLGGGLAHFGNAVSIKQANPGMNWHQASNWAGIGFSASFNAPWGGPSSVQQQQQQVNVLQSQAAQQSQYENMVAYGANNPNYYQSGPQIACSTCGPEFGMGAGGEGSLFTNISDPKLYPGISIYETSLISGGVTIPNVGIPAPQDLQSCGFICNTY